MAPLISSTVAILPSTLGNALVSAELTALAEGGVPPRMKSGGGSAYAAGAVATVARAVIAIAAIAAIAASDILRRVRRRTDEAFTPHTLLRSSPDRSRRTVSFDSNAPGGVPFATGRLPHSFADRGLFTRRSRTTPTRRSRATAMGAPRPFSRRTGG